MTCEVFAVDVEESELVYGDRSIRRGLVVEVVSLECLSLRKVMKCREALYM